MNFMMRVALASLVLATNSLAAPSVYPTGTTRYDPGAAFNGFTVLTPLASQAVVVIDMNGRVVKRWEDVDNAAGGPARVLPNGDVITAIGARPPHQEGLALVQLDFDGNERWRFDRNEEIEAGDGQVIWSSRQHHDWQRADLPAGYYSPAFAPEGIADRLLLLTHTNHHNDAVSDVLLEDDRLIEIDADGRVLWEWRAADHIGEFGFDAAARASIRAASGYNDRRGSYDWLHINSATYVGPNRWFDSGDTRFAADNVIISSRQAGLLAIIARDGSLVWQIGPDFSTHPALLAIGQIIGQHHAHLIPPGLPGAGNVMVFDNGGASGYGAPTANAPDGEGVYGRATSRVLEIDPVSLELVWSYRDGSRFFSTNISGAQRLPNGNTLITEGASGRLFEVTEAGDIAWEYMNPEFAGPRRSNTVYRAYRVPYDWLAQIPQPDERHVNPPPVEEFRVLPD